MGMTLQQPWSCPYNNNGDDFVITRIMTKLHAMLHVKAWEVGGKTQNKHEYNQAASAGWEDSPCTCTVNWMRINQAKQHMAYHPAVRP